MFSAKTVSTLWEKPEFCSYFNDHLYVWLLERKKSRKTRKKCVFRYFGVEKPVNACVEMPCCVCLSAGICFTGNDFPSTWLRVLTGVFNYFQLFEPCMTGTTVGQPILHQTEGCKMECQGSPCPIFCGDVREK